MAILACRFLKFLDKLLHSAMSTWQKVNLGLITDRPASLTHVDAMSDLGDS